MHLPVMNPNCTFGESSATLGLAAALQSTVTQCIAPNGNHLITSALTQNKVAKMRSKRKQMFENRYTTNKLFTILSVTNIALRLSVILCNYKVPRLAALLIRHYSERVAA